jgi:hypothetical protein
VSHLISENLQKLPVLNDKNYNSNLFLSGNGTRRDDLPRRTLSLGLVMSDFCSSPEKQDFSCLLSDIRLNIMHMNSQNAAQGA